MGTELHIFENTTKTPLKTVSILLTFVPPAHKTNATATILPTPSPVDVARVIDQIIHLARLFPLDWITIFTRTRYGRLLFCDRVWYML